MQGLNFSVPHQKLRVCETGALGKLREKVPTLALPPVVFCCLRNYCETGNVYAPDPEKQCFRSKRANSRNSEVVIDCVLNRYSIAGSGCAVEPIYSVQETFLFLRGA